MKLISALFLIATAQLCVAYFPYFENKTPSIARKYFVVKYKCEGDYVLIGKETLSYENNVWSSSVPKCMHKSNLAIKNGDYQILDNIHVKYSCHYGYQLQGFQIIPLKEVGAINKPSCISKSNWYNVLKQCPKEHLPQIKVFWKWNGLQWQLQEETECVRYMIPDYRNSPAQASRQSMNNNIHPVQATMQSTNYDTQEQPIEENEIYSTPETSMTPDNSQES